MISPHCHLRRRRRRLDRHGRGRGQCHGHRGWSRTVSRASRQQPEHRASEGSQPGLGGQQAAAAAAAAALWHLSWWSVARACWPSTPAGGGIARFAGPPRQWQLGLGGQGMCLRCGRCSRRTALHCASFKGRGGEKEEREKEGGWEATEPKHGLGRQAGRQAGSVRTKEREPCIAHGRAAQLANTVVPRPDFGRAHRTATGSAVCESNRHMVESSSCQPGHVWGYCRRPAALGSGLRVCWGCRHACTSIHPSIHPYICTHTQWYTPPPPAAPSCCSASRTYCTDGGGGIRWSQISAHGLVANPPKPILARTSNSAISHMSRRHIGASAAVAQGRMALPTRQPPVQEPSHDENAVPTARHTGRQALGPLSMNAHLPCPCQASLGFSR